MSGKHYRVVTEEDTDHIVTLYGHAERAHDAIGNLYRRLDRVYLCIIFLSLAVILNAAVEVAGWFT